MKRAILVGICACLGLAGCASPSSRVQNSVVAAEEGLTAAERAALIYTSLPRCPARTVCSDPAVVARIKLLDNQAYTAVMMAKQNEALVGAALTAISSLASAVPQVK